MATAVSGTLAVTVAGPAGAVAPGDTLMITVSARDAQARGALASRVAYGDATTDQNAQFCLAGAGGPADGLVAVDARHPVTLTRHTDEGRPTARWPQVISGRNGNER